MIYQRVTAHLARVLVIYAGIMFAVESWWRAAAGVFLGVTAHLLSGEGE